MEDEKDSYSKEMEKAEIQLAHTVVAYAHARQQMLRLQPLNHTMFRTCTFPSRSSTSGQVVLDKKTARMTFDHIGEATTSRINDLLRHYPEMSLAEPQIMDKDMASEGPE